MRPIDADRFECIAYRGVPEGYSDSFDGGVLYMADLIDEAPTVSPDEVRGAGEWEQREIINLEDTTIEQMQSACCSVCGKYHTTPFSYYFTEYNYCPSCGARMKGAEDGTTDAE